MTKKQIAEYIIIFILGLFVTVSVINPISKEYTIWNVIYKTKDIYNQQRKDYNMTKQIDWEEQRKLDQAKRNKAMKSLTAEQLKTIKKAYKTIGSCLDMITECNDLYLSDINKLNSVYWAIKHQFNLED